MDDLEPNVALITGGARGQGAAHAEALAGPTADPDARAALARALDALADDGRAAAVVAVTDRTALEPLLRGPSRVLDLSPSPALAQA